MHWREHMMLKSNYTYPNASDIWNLFELEEIFVIMYGKQFTVYQSNEFYSLRIHTLIENAVIRIHGIALLQ